MSDKYAFFKRHATNTPAAAAAAAAAAADSASSSSSPPDSTSPPMQQQPHQRAHPIAQQVAPRNPFQPAPAAVAQGPAALQARINVAIPARAQAAAAAEPDAASHSHSSATQLRKRMGSPSGAEPVSGAPAFPTNIGPSPRASAANKARINAVNTPGGNNVVFQLPHSTKASEGGDNGWAAASPRTALPSSYAGAAAAGTGHTQAAGNGFGHGYDTNNPINPFANNGTGVHQTARSKRKFSDPDVHATLLGHGRKSSGAMHGHEPSSSWSHKLRAPFLSLWRRLKGVDTKKDDNANGHAQKDFTAHKFGGGGGGQGAHDDLPANMATKIVNAFTLKNIAFFLLVSLVLGAVYLWATHECETDDDWAGASTQLAVSSRQEGGHLDPAHHAPNNPASLPGGIVASWAGANSLQEFEMRYPFLHPVLHFFKRPTDHAAHNDKHVASITQPDIPFTLVSLLRDMTPEFLAENKASYIFQYNALLSWVRLTPHVIVYMDSADSCTQLTARKEFKSVRCFAVPCIHDVVKRPLLNCIFEHSHLHSTTEAMGFVNGDIILSPSAAQLINKIGNEFQKYLVVSRRTDTHLPEYLIDAYIANYHARDRADRDGTVMKPAVATDTQGGKHVVADNVDNAIEYAASHAVLHSEFGIDLFLYPKSTFQWMFPNFPPFLAGVYRWDNYFLTKMILHPGVATIDASKFGLLIHQQIDGGKDHAKRTGAPINDALVKAHLGSIYKLGHINNVDYVLRGDCPQSCEISPNVNASVSVLYAKRANAANWMAIIDVQAGEHIELNNFICWANRISFRSFIFLTRDRDMYEEIMKREMPVIFLDRTLVDTPVGGKINVNAGDAESAAATLQRVDFLFSVLKAGYHFFYSTVRAVYLDDPLAALQSTPADPSIVVDPTAPEIVYDVQLRGNMTHIFAPPHAGPLAVRSSNFGQYFWKQVHDCADMNKHIADPSQWVDCILHHWRTLKGGVKKGVLNDWKFTDSSTFFVEKKPLMRGYYPVMIDDESVKTNVEKFARLNQWGLMATKAASPVCKDELPSYRASVFHPPTDKPEQDFRLKIRVLTFDRHASLQRLLNILQTANYENDKVDLEISIDYPLNMTDSGTIEKWTQTQLVARSFVWSHGKIEVIQQRTHIGLTGQWTQGWQPAEDNKELMLFLEDDTGVSPYFYSWCKRMIQTYYLNPNNYDPSMYGFALQTQHTVLGETLESRYGKKSVPAMLNATALTMGLEGIEREYFRYQLVGTWGGVFFPQHWREFLIWLRVKQFVHAAGTSPIFEPCVPTLLSNAWWQAKPHKVWSQWFVRFAFEKGWYNLYTNFPDQMSLVGNFREGGENFAVTKGLMNPMVDETNTPVGSELYQRIHEAPLPQLSRLPLFDFHFNAVAHADALKHRLGVWGNPANIPQCTTMASLIKANKEAAAKLAAKMERLRKEAEMRARDEDTSILAHHTQPPPSAAAVEAAKAKKKAAAGSGSGSDKKKKADAAKKDAKKGSGSGSGSGSKKGSGSGKKDDGGSKKDAKAADAKKKADAAKKGSGSGSGSAKKDDDKRKKAAAEADKKKKAAAAEAAKKKEAAEPAAETEAAPEVKDEN